MRNMKFLTQVELVPFQQVNMIIYIYKPISLLWVFKEHRNSKLKNQLLRAQQSIANRKLELDDLQQLQVQEFVRKVESYRILLVGAKPGGC